MTVLRIAILGGTGPHGRGLARRFALAGHDVRVGSRDVARAAGAATELATYLPAGTNLTGTDNQAAVDGTDVVVLAVPYAGLASLLAGLEGLDGRVVVSCVNPLAFDERGPHALEVPEGSAAELVAATLPGSRVVAAFHHVSALTLQSEEDLHDESVLVCGDDRDAKALVVELAGAVAGRGGIDAGPLRNARHLEGLTAVLLGINRRYKARTSIAITGL